MKHPELRCTFHQGVTCMGFGVLFVQQSLTPGTKEYTETVEVWGEEAAQGLNPFRTELGQFCTLSALMAWCEKQGAIPGARKGDLQARRPGSRAHPEQRPTVATRRPRQSLNPRSG
jgi:hypothetical protein